MLDVVTEHPDVLDDPAISVLFIEHADSTLINEIGAYVSAISKRLAMPNDLSEQMHNRLQGAGIDLSFPQRDIHITRKPKDEPLLKTKQSLPEESKS